jgi:hypothetical protein
MTRLILRLIGVFVLICLSIGFFSEHNYVVAVPLLFGAITLYIGYSFKTTGDTIRGIALEIKEDFYTNSSLSCDIYIAEVLKRPETQKIFNVLREPSKSPLYGDVLRADVSFEEWQQEMLSSYQRKNGEKAYKEHVHFYIRNGLLFKNNQITDSNVIIHEIHITYPESIRKSEISSVASEGAIEKDLTIQIVLSNGFLRLRVGNMSQFATTFEQSLRYRSWITLTSFPLMYCPQYHRIPARFLNINHQGDYANDEPNPKNKGDILKSLYQDVTNYKILCRFAESSEDDLKKLNLLKSYNQAEKDFKTKLTNHCANEHFQDNHADDRASSDNPFSHYAHTSGWYLNTLMSLDCISMNDLYEYRKDYYSDFSQKIL